MQAIGGRDADHIHARVRQQIPVLPVNSGAALAGGFLTPVPVRVAHGYHSDVLSGLNQPLHRVHVAHASAAHADKPDPESLVGAKHLAAREKWSGAEGGSGDGGGDKVAAANDGCRIRGVDLVVHVRTEAEMEQSSALALKQPVTPLGRPGHDRGQLVLVFNRSRDTLTSPVMAGFDLAPGDGYLA